MQHESDSHIPAAVLAQASFARASMLPPSLTAIGRYFVIRLIASSAKRLLVRWLIVARYVSTEWQKASMPVYAVILGGTLSISSGSTIDSVGNVESFP